MYCYADAIKKYSLQISSYYLIGDTFYETRNEL